MVTSWLFVKKSLPLRVEILLFWVMNRLFATYGNSFISYANASESLFATLTPPCKLINNQIVGCDSAASEFASALHWAHLRPWL